MPAATTPKTKPLTGPQLRDLVRLQDTIEVRKPPKSRKGQAYPVLKDAGSYTVVFFDIFDDIYPLKVMTSTGEAWMHVRDFVRIVTRDGKPYSSQPSLDATVPVAAIDPSKPLWEQVLKGDKIKTVRSNGIKAGIHVVRFTDHSLKDGPRGLGINVESHGWIFNDAVKEIVERDGKSLKTTAAVPEVKPAWELAEIGDTVKLVGANRVVDGDYTVKEVDNTNGLERRLRIVTSSGSARWVENRAVVSIVSAKTVVDQRPIWEQVRDGDRVRIEGSSVAPAGVYTVVRRDYEQYSGPRRPGIFVDSDVWVRNEHVKEIVERDGKPFGVAVSTDVVAVGQPALEADTSARLWTEVRPGDRVRISGDPDARDGDYTVTVTDEDAKLGPGEAGIHVDGGGYVFNRTIRQILERDGKPYGVTTPAVVAPISNEPLWKQVKVGDLIRVERGHDHPAGSFKVTRTEGYANRNAINYDDRNGGVWWIRNDLIAAIIERDGRPYQSLTTIDAEAKSQGVRGNFLIHVDVPTIMANKTSGTHRPVTAVRRIESPAAYEVFRELAWDGPTRFVHHEFMKIEGTDIHNWIETDGPITSWSDDAPLKILTAKPDEPALPMLKPILGAFVIHIAAPVLIRNRQEGRNDPVIAVRLAHSNWADDVFYCRKVEWSGPTRMVHRPSTPVPGTNGRGVAFVETDAVLTLTMDNAAPMVLRVPARRLAA